MSKIKDARQSKKNLVEFNKEAPKYASPTIDGGYDSNDLGDMAQAMQEHNKFNKPTPSCKRLNKIESFAAKKKYGICHTGSTDTRSEISANTLDTIYSQSELRKEEADDA